MVIVQLQSRLSRVQHLVQSERASSEMRSISNDENSNDAEDNSNTAAVARQVGPTANMSLLDQHSKLKMEALGPPWIEKHPV